MLSPPADFLGNRQTRSRPVQLGPLLSHRISTPHPSPLEGEGQRRRRRVRARRPNEKPVPIEGTGRAIGPRYHPCSRQRRALSRAPTRPALLNGGLRVRLLAEGVQRTGSGGIFRRGGCARLAPCPGSLGSAGGVLVSVIACWWSIRRGDGAANPPTMRSSPTQLSWRCAAASLLSAACAAALNWSTAVALSATSPPRIE